VEDSDSSDDEGPSEEKLLKYNKADKKPLESSSVFKIAILNQRHSLAYLTLNGYDCSKAIQDAIMSKQLNLILKILGKIPAHEKLDKVANKEGQSILHILFKYFDKSFFSDDEILDKYVMDIFKQRGVKLTSKDKKG